MRIARAVQRAFDRQRAVDLERLTWYERCRAIVKAARHDAGMETVVVRRLPCHACDLWRSQVDRLNAEIDVLYDQLRRSGLKPDVVRDGLEAGYQSPYTSATQITVA